MCVDDVVNVVVWSPVSPVLVEPITGEPTTTEPEFGETILGGGGPESK